MPSAHYWFGAAILLSSLALWTAVRDRSRLRLAWGLLALWAAVWASTLLPAIWRPADAVVNSIAVALIELAAIQIAVVLIFDLLLRRVHIPKLAVETLIVACYVAVLFNLLYKVGVNVTGIFATSAVAAAVVGLALQDMLSNIAGGIALELERGIRVGDFIRVGERSGRVRHVRLRHTAIDSPDGDTVILPNSHLTRSDVSICSRPHRHFIPFAMPYTRDPHEIVSTVESALRASPIPDTAADPAPLCLVGEMNPTHIGYHAVVWLCNPGMERIGISAVLTRIYFALQRAGIPATEISTLLEVRKEATADIARVDPLDVLRRTPILRLLADHDLVELASHLEHLSFAAGEHIIQQGEEGDSMYFIVQGKVAISFRSEDDVEREVSTLDAGDFFGEASLLTGESRSASAVARSRVDCYRLTKSGLHGFIQRLPELAEDMSVVLAHREMELEVVREKLDRETALRREGETQNELLKRIRRFFAN
jgi:small-conductance mechanosensitive channel/CRP-like cAMP-binding protein